MSFWTKVNDMITSAVKAATVTAGATLGGVIDAAITALETADRTRAAIITELATAASITEDEVGLIISGDTMCPTMPVLDAFAPVLNVEADVLVTAAEADGCTYETSTEEDAKAQAQVVAQFATLNAKIAQLQSELTAERKEVTKLKATIKAQEAAGAASATKPSPQGQGMTQKNNNIDTSSWTKAAEYTNKFPKKA